MGVGVADGPGELVGPGVLVGADCAIGASAKQAITTAINNKVRRSFFVFMGGGS